MSPETGHSYEFGSFRLDPSEKVLFCEDKPVALTPKVFETLQIFVEHAGRLLEKDELMQKIWQGRFVEESNLTFNIKMLRRVLKDDAHHPRFIETVPRRGYRFIAEVKESFADIAAKTEFDKTGAEPSPPEPKRSYLPIAVVAGKGIKDRRRGVQLALAACVAVTASAAYFAYSRYWAGGKANIDSAAGIRTIAVLPFANTSNDPETDYLSDGISESLISSLSQLPNMKVISFSSVMHYKGQRIDLPAVGSALRVRAVLMGRVVMHDDAISISAELVDVQDKSHLWGRQYERKLSDLIALKGEIAKDVSEELRLRLSGNEQRRLTKPYTNNAEAYQLYLKGRYYSARQTEDEIRKGIDYFNQAINVDPNYALAYAGLSNAYYGLSYMYLPPREAMPKAKAAAMRALELDISLAEAHTSLAIVKTFYEWDWSGAEREYRQAIELNQNYAPAHEWYGWHLALVGQPDKSILELERAQEIDPLSAEVSWSLGVSLFFARRYDKAIAQLLKTLELDPNMPLAHCHLAASYEQQGKSNEAIAEFRKATDLTGGSTLASLGHAYAVFGKRDEALKILDQLKKRSAQGDLPAYEMAILYTGLGDKDRAFEWLDKAYDDRSESMTALKVEPTLDSLRSDERFTKLMRRVGLTP